MSPPVAGQPGSAALDPAGQPITGLVSESVGELAPDGAAGAELGLRDAEPGLRGAELGLKGSEPAAPHPRLLAALLTIGFAVSIISALGSPMVPTVAAAYDVSLNTSQWILTAALLAGAVTTPLLGKLGDTRHRRTTMLAALAVMGFGALVATFDGPFWLLLAGRALQGIGLGLMPLAMAVARDHLPSVKAGPAVALLSISLSAGVGLGYPLSGLLAQAFGFHRSFLFAAVMSAIALAAAWVAVPSSAHLPRRQIDVVGALLMAFGLGLLVVALSQAGSWGWTSPRLLGSLAVAAVILAVCARHELSIDDPIVDLHTLRFSSVRVGHAVSLLAGVGMYFLVSLIIRYVQTPIDTGYGKGRSVLFAGIILVPFSLASLGVSRALPAIRDAVGKKWTCALGSAMFLAGMLIFTVARSTIWEYLIVLVLAGAGIGLVNASIPPMIVAAVPPEETASALGFNAVLRTVGSSWGSAASGALLSANTAVGARFPTDHGYTEAALVGIVVWVAVVAVAWPHAGRDRRRFDGRRPGRRSSSSAATSAADATTAVSTATVRNAH